MRERQVKDHIILRVPLPQRRAPAADLCDLDGHNSSIQFWLGQVSFEEAPCYRENIQRQLCAENASSGCSSTIRTVSSWGNAADSRQHTKAGQ